MLTKRYPTTDEQNQSAEEKSPTSLRRSKYALIVLAPRGNADDIQVP